MADAPMNAEVQEKRSDAAQAQDFQIDWTAGGLSRPGCRLPQRNAGSYVARRTAVRRDGWQLTKGDGCAARMAGLPECGVNSLPKPR
jgi:hypothetical protein